MDSIIVLPDVDYAKKKYEEIMRLVDKQDGYTPWYPDSVQGHVVGRMGEDGALVYLEKLGLKPFANYRSTETGCDIFLQGSRIRLEVKTWRVEQYEWGGRSISEKQIERVRRKADRIIWCTVDLKTNEVFVMGWSLMADFDTAPLVTKGKLNLQSYQLDAVREMSTFPDVGIPTNLRRTPVLL